MRRLPILPADPPTASRIGLAMRCVYPWTSGQRWTRREQGVEALVGNAVHKAAEHAVYDVGGEVDLPEADGQTAMDLVEVVQGYIAYERERPHRVYEAELPVEFDLHTGAGRVLPSSGQRDYGARADTGIVGTIDHLLWPQRDHTAPWPRHELLAVRDWKTGRQRGFAVEAARMQVRTLAVAVAAIHDVDEVATEIAHVTTSGVEIDWEVLDADAIGEHTDALYDLAARLGAGPSQPTPGPWCVEGYCPLLGECPASRGALVAVTHETPIIDLDDDADALHMIALLPRARAALKAAEDALEARVRRSPPRGPDGRRYGYVEHKRRDVVVDSPMKLAALATVLGPHAEGAVQMRATTSIEAIERQARRALGGRSRGIGELRDRALGALAQVGGVRERSYWKPGWFWPEGEGPDELPMAAEEDGYEG